MAGSFMIVESWLSEQSTSQNRGAVFGSYMMVVTLGYTTGQLGFSLFDPVAYVPFIVGAIGYCLALLPTALSTTTQPAPLSSTKLEVRVLFATSPVALVSILLIGISNGAFGTLGPVFAQQLELSTKYIAYFISAATIGGALLQFPLGKLSDLVDRRKVIAGVALAAAILSVVLALRSGSAPLLLCAMSLVYGMLIYTIYPIAISHANDWATNISPAQVSGTLLLVYGVGTMIGPIFASAAMAGMGPAGLFWFTCAAHAGIFSYSLWRVMVKTPVPAEDKGSFAAFPLSRAQTPETLAFDPRIEDEADWKED
jgi:MFS family permease